jgi:glutathione S-transferase
VLAWIKPMPELLQDKPAVAAWLQRCLERPAQQQVRALSRKS